MSRSRLESSNVIVFCSSYFSVQLVVLFETEVSCSNDDVIEYIGVPQHAQIKLLKVEWLCAVRMQV